VTELSWAWLSTPVGPVSVGCTTAGVARVCYGAPRAAQEHNGSGVASPARDADAAARALADTARGELTEYFRGDRRVFGVPVDWTATAGLQRAVLTTLADSVGYGHTISYGGLARAAGLTDTDAAVYRSHESARARGGNAMSPAGLASWDDPPKPPAGLAARAVGTIMGGNPIPVIVPCHRVVAADGLGGYSGGAGVEVKRWLLILEGSLPPTLDWQLMARPD
jgi:methylated-DNA-[protein]-cysteine S-methyltransferase